MQGFSPNQNFSWNSLKSKYTSACFEVQFADLPRANCALFMYSFHGCAKTKFSAPTPLISWAGVPTMQDLGITGISCREVRRLNSSVWVYKEYALPFTLFPIG